MTDSRIARCRCGGLTAECRGEPARNSICHCLACKARTGSAFSWNTTWPNGQVTIAGAASRFERLSDEGRWCRYAFCPTCGTTVFYEIEARPGMVSVPAGGFGDVALPGKRMATAGQMLPGNAASLRLADRVRDFIPDSSFCGQLMPVAVEPRSVCCVAFACWSV